MKANRGPVVRPGESGYDEERLGLNRAVESRPAVVVGAAGEQDVVDAVRLAADRGRAIGVLATGHGPSVSADDAVLINTRRMDGVTVDAASGTARVEAGARWERVLELTAGHGLAPLNGSSPNVGAVGYTVGGGAGLLGRRFGFAADHVRELRLVTADGRLRTVTAESEPDLFWAVRGGKDNFGLVTSMLIDLFPVSELYGGGLYFPGESITEVLHGYAEWSRGVPEEMASSVLFAQNPDLPGVPEPLRGRFVVHVRVAHSGGPAEGERLVRPLRSLAPALLDTVRTMPYAEVGTIHHEPVAEPYASHDRNLLLRELTPDAVEEIISGAGPGSAFVTELRHFGGAYARRPRVPNCVGGRDAAYSLYTGAVPDPGTLHARDTFLARLHPWSTGAVNLNFAGPENTTPTQVASAFTPSDHARLTHLKSRYDPTNLFRVNFNIPPAPSP
ncbi:FAD-binding oxidoreductase [Actinocorallia longicatena]|uniref:FAD-binding oxidoreductase n=1 Tax=Actinocorallia longicatena TaxID=111803 RepID=A0ABP6QDR0_9ACTN